jgi:hypothetical protein
MPRPFRAARGRRSRRSALGRGWVGRTRSRTRPPRTRPKRPAAWLFQDLELGLVLGYTEAIEGEVLRLFDRACGGLDPLHRRGVLLPFLLGVLATSSSVPGEALVGADQELPWVA